MRDISYEEQTVMSSNPLARYAHRTRMAVALELVSQHCPQYGTVVDFGSGPGLLLHVLGELRRDIVLIGYDPYMSPVHPEVRYADSMHMIDEASVDVLTAFEVCEHLYAHEVDQLLADALRILKPGAPFIVSVPIMYGLATIPKVMNWMMRQRTLRTEYSLGEILMSVAGVPVTRPENPRITHKGFDFRELRDTIATQLSIERVRHSPASWLPWWLSSQYFIICRKSS
ncbi:class I SAM-dependent methyltransferase [Trinickia mobilis]|uniref:class I SAM-dependent methyltransferase n=1 Tax=Trinickia mobilis TaxID=2816356 RepID=UPI001A8C7765|nr:class I SAM-dependent methyltransferase [Trinickia mobilis]